MDAVVLSVPRETVLAEQLAGALHAATDTIAMRVLGLPWRTDVGMGVIVEDGDVYLDQRFIDMLGIDDDQIGRIAEHELETIEHHSHREHPIVDLHGRTAIVIDDGSTPAGMLNVALRAVRKRGAARVILALSNDAPRTVERVRDAADAVVTAGSSHE